MGVCMPNYIEKIVSKDHHTNTTIMVGPDTNSNTDAPKCYPSIHPPIHSQIKQQASKFHAIVMQFKMFAKQFEMFARQFQMFAKEYELWGSLFHSVWV